MYGRELKYEFSILHTYIMERYIALRQDINDDLKEYKISVQNKFIRIETFYA